MASLNPPCAPGPFYSLRTCLACGAPELEAPDLLSVLSDDDPETHFVRQPRTPEEVEQACRAMEVCCLGALRYGGTEPAIIRRLGNDPQYCDVLLPEETQRWRAIWARLWKRG